MKLVGTSGFAYKQWEGVFYPEKTPAKKYLNYYAEHFKTVEINNTFYRIPAAKTTRHWVDQVPDDFRFAIKMNQRITHSKRLRNVEEEMGWFLEGITPLSAKLACLLVQLPPWFRQDLEVLGNFLAIYASEMRLALEFRHASWTNQATYDLLASHGAALVVAESDKLEPVKKATAPFIYIRLRKSDYTLRELDDWVRWIEPLKQSVLVYFKHAQGAPEQALYLLSSLRADAH